MQIFELRCRSTEYAASFGFIVEVFGNSSWKLRITSLFCGETKNEILANPAFEWDCEKARSPVDASLELTTSAG